MDMIAKFIAQLNVELMNSIAMEEEILGVVLMRSFVGQVKEV